MNVTNSGKYSILAVLSLAGIVGSVLGAWDLKRAITLCHSLYSLDVVSLELESDLEDDMEASRRTLLTVLISADGESSSDAIKEAHAASTRVQDTILRLRSLEPEARRLVDQFERSWFDYARVADQIFRITREGDRVAAVQAERTSGQFSFGTALQNLRVLKQGLEEHAKVDSAVVDRTLKHSVWAFVEFGVALWLFLLALGKASHDRRKALVALKSSNDALTTAKDVEQARAAILEMVGAHEPLGRTLGAIVELPQKCGLSAGAAIWVANDKGIELQAVAPAFRPTYRMLCECIRYSSTATCQHNWRTSVEIPRRLKDNPDLLALPLLCCTMAPGA